MVDTKSLTVKRPILHLPTMIQSLNTATANTKKPLTRIHLTNPKLTLNHLINPTLTLNLRINLKRTTNLMVDTDSLMASDTDSLNTSDTDISRLTVDTTDPMV